MWYEQESIIPRAYCIQLCVKLHRSTTMIELIYVTHSQEYKVTSSLKSLTLLPLLALSVVSQTSTVENA